MTPPVTPRGRSSQGGNGGARESLPVVIALVLGAKERARIQDALRHRARVCHVESIAQLLAQLDCETSPLLGLIAEGTDTHGREVADTIRDVRRRMPGLTILGYCGMGPQYSAEIRALAAAGAHELIFRDIDDRGVALQAALASAAQACAAEQLLEQFAPLVPESLHPFIGYCLRYPQKAHTVTEVATALGLNRKTFANYSIRAGMLPPAELLAWCRLLLVAYYLDSTTKTVEAIAILLDFPSDTALRNMMKRYSGLRAQEVRARGGVASLIDRFARAASRRRDAAASEVGKVRAR